MFCELDSLIAGTANSFFAAMIVVKSREEWERNREANVFVTHLLDFHASPGGHVWVGSSRRL